MAMNTTHDGTQLLAGRRATMKVWSSLLARSVSSRSFALLSVLLLIASPLDRDELIWILGNLAVGVVLIGRGAVSGWGGLRERLHSGEARRAGKYGTAAVLSTLLGLVILGLLGFLAARHSVRFDWSEARVHSLSDQTKKLLASLTEDARVTALVPALEQAKVRDVLDRYTYESPRFVVDYQDPTARPDLVERFGIAAEKLGNGVVRIEIGNESTEVTEFSEQQITNALVKLTRTGEKKVYFLQGHGERSVEGEGAAEPDGMKRRRCARQRELPDGAVAACDTNGVPADAGARDRRADAAAAGRGRTTAVVARGGGALPDADPTRSASNRSSRRGASTSERT